MPRLLLIDDDTTILPQQIRLTFPGPTYDVSFATTGEEGLRLFRAATPDVVLLDLRLPDRSGMDLYNELRSIDRRVPIVFITMTKGADDAIEAMKRGAFDYLFKPVELKHLQRIVKDALEVSHRMRAPVVVSDSGVESDAEGTIVGNSPQMREVYKSIGRVSAQDVPVLITGESGTGKELIARAIYQHGSRAGSPFLVLNCAAIPEQLLESELFGHEKGAFTGADRRRIGKFEQVNGGTLFLDEIGDMPLALQAKMLRVLQEQQFERVGGNETIRTDVRILAATHRDLKAWSSEGKFRADLYYRLSVFTIELPPLRYRIQDLDLLVPYYLRMLSGPLRREIRSVAPETFEILRKYPWPGNIRELQSVIKQSLLHSSGETLLPSFLPRLVCEAPSDNGDAPPPTSPPPSNLDLEVLIRDRLQAASTQLHDEVHREVDRLLITKVLEFTGGNQHGAARVLGISRQTLRARMRDFRIQVMQSVESPDADEG